MFNCIESDVLFGLCEGMQLREWLILDLRTNDHPTDVYVMVEGSAESMESGRTIRAYRLSDYLLATAPVDVT